MVTQYLPLEGKCHQPECCTLTIWPYKGSTFQPRCHVYVGIAQIAITPPLPRTQTGTLGHFFLGRFERLCQITVLRVYIVPQRILASLKSLVNKRKYLIELQFSLH